MSENGYNSPYGLLDDESIRKMSAEANGEDFLDGMVKGYDPMHIAELDEDEVAAEPGDFKMNSPEDIKMPEDVVQPNAPDDTEYQSVVPNTTEPIQEEDKKQLITWLTVIGVVVVIVVIVVVAYVNRHKGTVTNAAASEVASSAPDNVSKKTVSDTETVVNPEVIKVGPKKYVDTVAIKKSIVMENGSFICYFEGLAKAYGRKIKFNVSVDQYNKYVDGTALKIEFKATKINKVDYITDIVIKG